MIENGEIAGGQLPTLEVMELFQPIVDAAAGGTKDIRMEKVNNACMEQLVKWELKLGSLQLKNKILRKRLRDANLEVTDSEEEDGSRSGSVSSSEYSSEHETEEVPN